MSNLYTVIKTIICGDWESESELLYANKHVNQAKHFMNNLADKMERKHSYRVTDVNDTTLAIYNKKRELIGRLEIHTYSRV